MSIKLKGVLHIQKIQGRYGEFSVGKLDTDIASLSLKSPELDQFDCGSYKGDFLVSKIYSRGYMTNTGSFVVELRADVSDYIFLTDDVEKLHSDFSVKDIDHLEESESTSTHDNLDNSQDPELEPEPENGIDYRELFGELWPLGSEVVLDPTNIRSDPKNHRLRVAYLNSKNYEFKPATQKFVKLEAEEIVI